MKNKKSKHHHKTIHQRIEALMRHRLSVVIVAALMLIGVLSLDSRLRHIAQDMYASGWGWIGTYLHHEHPAHIHLTNSKPRLSTISGPV